jgi:hypothetical protein
MHGSVTSNFGNLVAAFQFPDCELPRRRAAVIALAGLRHMARAVPAFIARKSPGTVILPSWLGISFTMATSKF